MTAKKAALVKHMRYEQGVLFNDLLNASSRAINGYWSMNCQGIVERIRESAGLVGVGALWDEVNWDFYRGGVWHAVYVGYLKEAPTIEQLASASRLMASHSSESRLKQAKLVAAAIKLEMPR